MRAAIPRKLRALKRALADVPGVRVIEPGAVAAGRYNLEGLCDVCVVAPLLKGAGWRAGRIDVLGKPVIGTDWRQP